MSAPWVLCPARERNGTCSGCTADTDRIVLSLSLREDIAHGQEIVARIAALLLELLAGDNPFPTPWVLHKAPRFALDTRDWVITAPALEQT